MAEDDDDASTTPGVAFQAKHVLGKTLKSGAIGAVIGGGLFAAATAIVGCAGLMAIPVVGGLFCVAGASMGSGIIASAATTGAMWGAGIGGGLGAVSGLGDVREATLEEQDRLEERAMRKEAREDRKMALAERKQQQYAAMQQDAADRGLTPSNLPFGRGSDGPAIG